MRRRFRRRRIVRRRRTRRGRMLNSRIRRVIRQTAETKVYLTPIAVTVQSTPRQYPLIPVIPQGVTTTSRVGDQIRIKRLSFRLNIEFVMGTAGATIDEMIRIAVIFPRKGLSNNYIQNVLLSPGINDFFDPTKVFVMYDKMFRLGTDYNPSGVASTGTLPSMLHVEWSKRWKQVINYANVETNMRTPILWFVTSNPTGNGSTTNVFGQLRMSYIDV